MLYSSDDNNTFSRSHLPMVNSRFDIMIVRNGTRLTHERDKCYPVHVSCNNDILYAIFRSNYILYVGHLIGRLFVRVCLYSVCRSPD